ncbi:MAG: S-layer homology domain-containing protein, partial [Actinomycetota bacterium]
MRFVRFPGAALIWVVAAAMLAPSASAVSHPFTDITAPWQVAAVDWLWTEGITDGVSDTEFGPGRGVTRGEMAAFLHRAAGEPGGNPAHPFVDVTAPWQEEPVRWLSDAGITDGVSADRYAPRR